MSNYKLYIKVVNDNEVVKKYYANYKTKNEGDSGIDLITPFTEPVKWKSGVNTLDFGIQCKITKDDKPISYYLYPRSSISSTPLMLANSVGVIDAGYRGNIMAKFRCFEEYDVLPNSRFCQLCTPTLEPIKEIILVDSLDVTTRGSGGFGSTNTSDINYLI